MQRLTYAADSHHVLLEDGKRIHGGESFEVSDERAAQLLADPRVPVRPDADLAQLTRDELNDLAREAGVEQPEGLPNKAAVIAAIENPPEANAGEGPTTTPRED